MSDEDDAPLSEADAIAALLPWYVSGKISQADRAKIDAYAERHPEARAHIAHAQSEADAVFTANQKIALPRAALDKLKDTLVSSPGARLAAAEHSFLDRIGLALAGLSPRNLAFAGLAAALAVALQAAVLGALLSLKTATRQTAPIPNAAHEKGTFAMVAFQTAAPLGTLAAFLADNKFAVVEGPKPGGLFRVRVSDDTLSKDALEAAIAKLKARTDLVSFASLAP